MLKENKQRNYPPWSLKSMTGLGHARVELASFGLEVIIKSLNSKSLDIKIKTPRELSVLESVLCSELSGLVNRGRIEILINLASKSSSSLALAFDELAATNALASLEAFAAKNPRLEKNLRIADLLSVQGFWREAITLINQEELSAAVLSSFKDALTDFLSARSTEGQLLAESLKKSLDFCQTQVAMISNRAEVDVKNRYESIRLRVNELFAGFDLNQDRIYQECALLAERSDYKEEIDRLSVHIKHFSSICCSDDSKGRKLDFLCQEMLRESNTLISKAFLHEVMAIAIDLKAEIERLREQVQNIE